MDGDIAIVGAGIAGLALALLLAKRNLKSTIYELRSPKASSEGAITLSPNGLQVLNAIDPGLARRIFAKGYRFRALTFRSKEHDSLDAYEVGNSEKYGFDAYRVYRQIVLDELKSAVEELNIRTVYNRKFSHVVSEQTSTVTFAFEDGSQKEANVLIGADGIHSMVRRYLLPDVRPMWSNTVAVSCASPTVSVNFPSSEYMEELPVSIHGPSGAAHIAPQNAEGSEVVVAIQWLTHERTRSGWNELNEDKEQLRNVMLENGDANAVTKSAITAAPEETFSIWPIYTMPKLEKWYSKGGRILIIGDSAHSLPTAGGQGANQALEDAYSLSVLIAKGVHASAYWTGALHSWQRMRQDRVDTVVGVAKEIKERRMPGWTGGNVASIDSTWLLSENILGSTEKLLKQFSLD